MTDITLPHKIGIKQIDVYRRRAEVTVIEIGYYHDSTQVTDGFEEVPTNPAQRTYKPHDPSIYDAHKRDVRLFLKGYWKWGGGHIYAISKVDRRNFVDRIELDYFTGSDEPWNTRVTLFLDGELKPTEGPQGLADYVDIADQLADRIKASKPALA